MSESRAVHIAGKSDGSLLDRHRSTVRISYVSAELYAAATVLMHACLVKI